MRVSWVHKIKRVNTDNKERKYFKDGTNTSENSFKI